ncbi:MAG: DUF4241 domain-containing protein [Treponema sp.]|nr:DUF4241 domain-containing protein [Treponema sp.]
MYINERLLNCVFEDESALSARGIQKEDLGALHLPTGKIIAGDPILPDHLNAFSQTVDPGAYTVSVYLQEERPSLAAIKFSDKKAAKWEMALCKGQDIEKLGKKNTFFGYDVDSGKGSFMDEEILQKLNTLRGGFDNNLYKLFRNADCALVAIKECLQKLNMDSERSVFDIFTESDTAAVFASGWGDGRYPSYFGMDENGKPCILVTDFRLGRNES